MGIFSFFKKPQVVRQDETEEHIEFDEYLTKDFFSELVDNNSSMMLYFTKKDGWVGANRLFLETFKYSDIREFRQEHDSVRDIFLNESEEIFTEDDKSWLDYIKKYKHDGYDVTIAINSGRILSISAKCHTFSNRNEVYILELDDVSELHTSQLKTKEVEKLKTKFLSNIGHEFRTPMNGILGFVELLGKTDLDKKQREYLNMINRSSKNLMANIETLLDLSQMQSGRLQVENTPFAILDEMEKIAYNLSMSGRDKGIKVLSFIDPKLPRELDGDIRKIKQIMNSLAQNAIKFTSRGGKVIIEVKLLKRQLNGDCSISFSIKDNGKGIAQEQLALILEPFNAGNQADERLGVGLSLSHGLVNLLGSELRIQSEEGEGSYFNFVLDFLASKGQTYKMMPKKKVKVLLLDQSKVDEANFLTIYLRAFAIDVVKSNVLDATVYDNIDALYIVADHSDSSWMFELGSYTKDVPVIMLLDESQKLPTKLTYLVDEIIHKPLQPSSMAKHLYSMYSLERGESIESKLQVEDKTTALVVEDNLINQRLIQILLQEYNILVSTASNGIEAVKMCETNRYDIVFMDIDMPEKNGIVATKEIKEALNPNGKTPFVALTAMAMEGDREMLLQSGLDDYISKPLTREKLENILNRYLKVVS
ncbi:MAG: response regulator [Campylobacterota bacterium]|nr:response regulator [Campylobacterota bacterium]